MKRILAIIAAAVALFAAATEAQPGVPVNLKDQLVDSDGRVTLGDLFDNAGNASGVLLANGPAAGSSVVLDAYAVQAIARRWGLDWANDHGFRRLVVKAGSAGAGQAAGEIQVLAYTRSLAAGEIVQPQDVIWTKVQAHMAPANRPADAEAVIGQAARRPLREGAAVAVSDLSKPVVVKKGDLISVTYNMDGVSLSLQAQATQSGAVGDPIAVLNPQSKKTIVAVVTGPGTAAVGPEADSLRSANRLASNR
jgi:flagella basal body P-ring formation protein FlgA